MPVATTWLAIDGHVASAPLLIVAVAALGIVAIVGWGAKRLICDPYVDTVVRMEGLAAGDLATPIRHTASTDCVGRMTKAMDVFRRNGEVVKEAGAAQEQVVGALGQGLARLAASDLSHRIERPFPADYERLRIDYNQAMDAV
ncbi:MAG: methyl-accepting chemotaxis protein, partial [Sphingomonas sp.]